MLHFPVGTARDDPGPTSHEESGMRNDDEQTKSRTGALAMGLLLLVTIGAAGCEQRRDTQVVDTPNGSTVTTTETVGVDHERVDQAKDAAGRAADQAGAAADSAAAAAGRAADKAGAAAGRAADQVSASAHDAKSNLSDAGLTAKVKTRLGTDSRVHATDINVDTNHGVVTLKGNVASEAERKAAVDLARGTDGVSDVVDQLKVAGQ
jgi:hyperosmotically inducible protein